MSKASSLLPDHLRLIVLSAAAVLPLLTYHEIARQFEPATPSLPAILHGATPGTGTSMSCEVIGLEGVAHSTEIVTRLRQQFPAGTSAETLEQYLREHGFTITLPCPHANRVRLATFNQKRGGGLSYPAFAEIWWQNESGLLAWMTADIRYNGL